MRYLALILFVPAFAILAWLYWKFPRALPVTGARRGFDLAVLVVAIAGSLFAVASAISPDEAKLGQEAVSSEHGPMWPQILAVLAAWHVYPFVLGIAYLVRGRLFGRRSGEFTRV